MNAIYRLAGWSVDMSSDETDRSMALTAFLSGGGMTNITDGIVIWRP